VARRRFMVFAVAVLVCLGSVSTARGKPMLRVIFSLTESEWHVMRRDILPPFEAKWACRIEANQVSQENLPKLLEALRIAGKMSIDVFGQDNMQLSILVKKNLVQDLSSEKQTIPQTVIPALTAAGVFDGKLYFMPYRPNVQIVYYDKDRFDRYGLAPPKNWDELYSVARTFHEREGIGRVLIKAGGGIATTTQMYEFIVSAGGNPLTFDDDGCIDAFTFVQKLWKYVAPDSRKAKYDTSNDYLAREACYLMQNWPFGYPLLVRDYGKTNIRVYGGFAGPVRRVHVVGGDVLGIPVGAPHRDLALAFIRYLQTREVQEKLVGGLGWPSIRTDAYSRVPRWMEPPFEAVKESLQYGVFRANVPYWTEFNKLFNEAFIRVVIRGEPVTPTLAEYHEKLERVKKKGQ